MGSSTGMPPDIGIGVEIGLIGVSDDSTSAFAPRYYPKEIIGYASTRGADKIIYAGYFPKGNLQLCRTFTDI